MRTRRLAVLLALLAALLPAGRPHAASPETELRATLRAYIQAMRRGDLPRLRPHLADTLYERDYRTLFEENAEYAHFLRHFYRGAALRLDRVSPAADGASATAALTITLRDGSTQPVTLDLVRDPDGTWKITRIGE